MTAKLLALAASKRVDSLNKRLIAIAAAQAEDAGAHVTLLDYAACDCPLYFEDDSQDLPAGARYFADELAAHDGLLLASPEYNWSIPGALKNLIDWLSVDKHCVLKGKAALLMCASPSVRGGILGLQQLSVPLMHLGMHVYPHLVAIGAADAHVTDQGIGNAKDAAFLRQCVGDFVHVTRGLKR